MDAATFRADFTEFSSTSLYPDSAINFWLNLAGLLILPTVWGDIQPFATELFIAHNLAIERAAIAGSAGGGVPGLNFGVTSGKTVDKLSITYDSQAGLVADAGHWNLTTFGTRFIQLARLAGMGGYQAGAGAAYMAPGTVIVVGGPYGPGWPYYGP
jgi:hypothetical protein